MIFNNSVEQMLDTLGEPMVRPEYPSYYRIDPVADLNSFVELNAHVGALQNEDDS